MNDKSQRYRKKCQWPTVVCKFGIRLEAPSNMQQNQSKMILLPVRDSNRAPTEYNSKALQVGTTESS